MKRNNIFDYAGKELSQDAVICWLLGWFNSSVNELHLLSVELLSLFGEKELPPDEEIHVLQQYEGIDLLILLEKSHRAILIEHKISPTERELQCARHQKALMKIKTGHKLPIRWETPLTGQEISTVYLKMDFYSDEDRYIEKAKLADVIVHGKDILSVLEKYANHGLSYLLDDYYDHLKRRMEWNDHMQDIASKCRDGSWALSRECRTQYSFLRKIFPVNLWDISRGPSGEYAVCCGSSQGRPWAQVRIARGLRMPNGEDSIFWRIDTDSQGVYLSLRYYDKYAKYSRDEKLAHMETYHKFRTIVEKIVREHPELAFRWEDIKGDYSGKYFETTLLIIHFGDALRRWHGGEDATPFVRRIQRLNECFLTELAG